MKVMAITGLMLFFTNMNSYAIGNLYIVGGGNQSDALIGEFLDLCKRESKIVVISHASSTWREASKRTKTWFERLGATDVHAYGCDKGEHNQASCLAVLKDTSCVYFSGGDQLKYTNHFSNTQFLEKIKSIHQNGGTIGGTSAGAAIMSEIMLTGRTLDSGGFNRIARNYVETIKGFGFIQDFIVDQHFIKRQRQNRLISSVLDNPTKIGVGIDESTAIIFEGSKTNFRVTGQSYVMVYRYFRNQFDLKVLGAGDIFSL